MDLASRASRVLQDQGPISLARRGSKRVVGTLKARAYELGSSRACPICRFSGRAFVTSGHPPRADALCPRCGAAERHRLLWHYVENETEILQRGGNVLYFAPYFPPYFAAANLIEEHLAERANLVTTDLAMDSVDVRGDVTRLPFEDATFDAVICSHVLEHVPDDRGALSELFRILDAGGDALIMLLKDRTRERTHEDDSITSPEARREAFGHEDHVRWYGRDVDERLSEAGFDVSVETYAQELSEAAVQRYGLLKRPVGSNEVEYEDIHHCRKPSDSDG